MASYLVSVRQFTAFLQPRGCELEEATRADLEAFIAELLTSRSAATASTRYKQLQALYRWLEDEEEIAVNPMVRMKPPMVPDKLIPVVPEDALRAVGGMPRKGLRGPPGHRPHHHPAGHRRPPRRGRRPAGRRLDFDLDVALVLGKGRRERALPFGRTTAVALDRYLRVRARHCEPLGFSLPGSIARACSTPAAASLPDLLAQSRTVMVAVTPKESEHAAYTSL